MEDSSDDESCNEIMASDRYSALQVADRLDESSDYSSNEFVDADSDDELDSAPSAANPDVHVNLGNEEELGLRNVVRRRNPSVTNKPVYDVHSALDINNYDKIDETAPTRTYRGILEISKNKKPSKKIEWTSERPRTSGRQPRSAILVGRSPGLKETARGANDPKSAWKLFFTPTMISMLLQHTNRRMRSVSGGRKGED